MLEENKTIVCKMIDVINSHNLAKLDEFIVPEAVYFRNEKPLNGLEVIKQALQEEIKAFPDLHVTIKDIMAEGNKVCVRFKETYTHSNEYQGIAPTGKKLTDTAIAIFLIAKGKIVQGWGVYDQMDFLTKLGVVEYKGFPNEAT